MKNTQKSEVFGFVFTFLSSCAFSVRILLTFECGLDKLDKTNYTERGKIVMKRALQLLSVLFVFGFGIIGCTEEKPVDLTTVDIEAIDQVDIPAGTYSIPYTIEELSDLVKTYGAVVSFHVWNHLNEEVTVEGDTFVVEAGEVYTVTIILTVQEQTKEKTITVTAVSATQMVEVFFDAKGGSGYEESQLIEFGSVPNLEIAPVKEDYVFDGWYLDEECTTRYLGEGIEQDTTLYANWLPVEVALTTVSFDLNGGNGDFPDQTVVIGTFATRPTTNPTRTGYLFTGWYVALNSSQPFDFETMFIYTDTVIYAHWEVDLSNVNFTVSYDLNGALQTETISETVSSGAHPSGLELTPIYPGHVFIGWSLDPSSLIATPVSSIEVYTNITLYAVWHIDFVVYDGTNYYSDYTSSDDSTIVDGWVEQRMNLSTTFNKHDFLSAVSLQDDFVEYGVLYGTSSSEITYYDAFAKKVLGTISLDSIDYANTVYYDLTTEALLSEAVYFAVFYIRTNDSIVYSPSYEFETCMKVQEGTSVGANYVLSGGFYQYDTGSESFRPSMFIEIMDGYSALLNGVPYNSFSQIYSEGTHSLITMNTTTGKRFLHVFNVDFQYPEAVMTYWSSATSNSSVSVTYQISFPHDEYISYHVSEVGILYSYDNPFVKLDLPGVIKKSATIDYGMGTITTNTDIASSERTVYVRAYVIMNGKVSYSNTVTKLEYANSEYSLTANYTIDDNKMTLDQTYDYYYGNTSMKLYTLNNDSYGMQEVLSHIALQGAGQYFITPMEMLSNSMIIDVLIIDDVAPLTGVEEGQVYQPGVLVQMNMYNPYWYYSMNGQDYYDLPSSVRLTIPGYYTIYYRSGNGMMEIHFEIASNNQ